MRVQLIGHLGVPGGWLRGLLGQALCLLEVGLPEAPGPTLIVPVSYHSPGHSQRLKDLFVIHFLCYQVNRLTYLIV